MSGLMLYSLINRKRYKYWSNEVFR